MDPIYESYKTAIRKKHRPTRPTHDPRMDKTSREVADIADQMFKRNISDDMLSELWSEVAQMFNLVAKPISSNDKKKFLANFEEVGMDMDDGMNVDASMLKQHMKKWLER